MAPASPDKDAVVAAIVASLTAELDAVERVAAMARDEVASDETRQEGKYDTRATEASYLARGQAWRVAALRRLKAWFEVFSERDLGDGPGAVIGIGSLVRVAGHRQIWLFLAPTGGPSVDVGGVRVQVISPDSPLGGALTDLEVDDAFEIDSPRGVVEYEVLEVS